VAAAARERVLAEHTAQRRVAQLHDLMRQPAREGAVVTLQSLMRQPTRGRRS
jgi:hypothetical protein